MEVGYSYRGQPAPLHTIQNPSSYLEGWADYRENKISTFVKETQLEVQGISIYFKHLPAAFSIILFL